jgi:hypothetical protein
MSKRVIDIDPTDSLPRYGDIVRFRDDGFDWRVTLVVAWANTIYIESVLGKKKAVDSITNILTIKRDLSAPRPVDFKEQYSIDI